jgi:hypothetical protein
LAKTPFLTVPEISVGKNQAQSGIAKVIVFAYDRTTHEPIWQSGIAKAEATAKDSWVLGAGPFQKGTIYKGVRFAGKRFDPTITPLPTYQSESSAPAEIPSKVVPFGEAYSFVDPDNADPDGADPSELSITAPNQQSTNKDIVRPSTAAPKIGTVSFEEPIANQTQGNPDP